MGAFVDQLRLCGDVVHRRSAAHFSHGQRKQGVLFRRRRLFIMAGWWLAEALTDLKMFQGAWGIAFRVIMAATLLLTGYVYFKERKGRRWNGPGKRTQRWRMRNARGADAEYVGDSEPYYDQASSEEDALPEENAGISPAETAEKQGEED